jgi:hypothetical protein
MYDKKHYIEQNNVDNRFDIDFDKAVNDILKTESFDEILKLTTSNKMSVYSSVNDESGYPLERFTKRYPKTVIEHVMKLFNLPQADIDSAIETGEYIHNRCVDIVFEGGVKKYVIEKIIIDFTAKIFGRSVAHIEKYTAFKFYRHPCLAEFTGHFKTEIDKDLSEIRETVLSEKEHFEKTKYTSVKMLEDDLYKYGWSIQGYVTNEKTPHFTINKITSKSLLDWCDIEITPELIANDFLYWDDYTTHGKLCIICGVNIQGKSIYHTIF